MCFLTSMMNQLSISLTAHSLARAVYGDTIAISPDMLSSLDAFAGADGIAYSSTMHWPSADWCAVRCINADTEVTCYSTLAGAADWLGHESGIYTDTVSDDSIERAFSEH